MGVKGLKDMWTWQLVERPIVSTYSSCPTDLVLQYLDQIMSPFVKPVPLYIKDSDHVLRTFREFDFETKAN